MDNDPIGRMTIGHMHEHIYGETELIRVVTCHVILVDGTETFFI